jgi:hypothetical protein
VKLIAKFTKTAENILDFGQVFGGFFRAIKASTKALDIILQPNNKFFSIERVLVFTQERKPDGPKR